MASNKLGDLVAEAQALKVLGADQLVADAADGALAVVHGHADVLGGGQGQELADVVQQGGDDGVLVGPCG